MMQIFVRMSSRVERAESAREVKHVHGQRYFDRRAGHNGAKVRVVGTRSDERRDARDFALTVEDRHSSCLSRHLVNLLKVNTTVSSALQYLCEMRTPNPEM